MTNTEELALRIQQRAFFDELTAIEKRAMIDGIPSVEKTALSLSGIGRGVKGLVSNIGLGAQRLRSPAKGGEGFWKGIEDLRAVYGKGAQEGGAWRGIGDVLKTRRGQALAAAGLGGTALIGGGGFLAGRMTGGRGNQQNVYVR